MSLVPLLQKDLSLIARRKRWFAARTVLVGLLLLITAPLFIMLWFSMSSGGGGGGASQSARGLFLAFAWTQVGLVALASPALGAGTLADTRTDASLDLLRLASISRPSLAFAKLVGASLWPIILACSQIPFLALWALWGGVTGTEMFACVTLTAATAVALIALGLASGTVVSSPGLAFATSYGLAIVYTIFLPIGLSALPGDLAVKIHPLNALAAILVQKSTASAWPWSIAAVTGLAFGCGIFGSIFLVVRDAVKRSGRATVRDRRSRKVWDRSVMWRELRSAGGRRAAMFVRTSWILSFAATMVAVVTHNSYRSVSEVATVVAFAVFPPILFAVLGSSSVAQEKEAGTILPLLLAPHGSSRVVFGKLVGVMVRGAPVMLGPALIVVVHMEEEMLYAWFAAALGAAHFGGVGVLCSVMFKRVPAAVAATFIGGAFQLAYAFVFFLLFGFLALVFASWLFDVRFEKLVEMEMAWVIVGILGFGLVTAFNVYLASALFEPMARLDR